MAGILGLDLGGTRIKLTRLDLRDGEEPGVGPLTSVATHADGGPDRVVEAMITAVDDVIEREGPVAAVGVGVPGLFHPERGTIELFPNLPGPWPGYPIRERLETALRLPVTLINDARAFTLGEGRLGAGRGCRTVICVTLGTGVGGGVLIDGRLHLGASGKAGEVGHQTVLDDGPLCGCGNRGCAEPLVQGLAARAGRSSVEAVFAGAAAGDARCREAIDAAARWLGIAIANVVTVLVPDRVVIGGGMTAAGDAILEPIRAAVAARTPLVPPDRLDIRLAALGQQAGAIGAALAASDR